MSRASLALAVFCIPILAGCGNGNSSDFKGDIEQFFVQPATDLPEVKFFQRRGKVLALDIDNRRLDPVCTEN